MSVDLDGMFLGPCSGSSVDLGPCDVEPVHLNPGELSVFVGIESIPSFNEVLGNNLASLGYKFR